MCAILQRDLIICHVQCGRKSTHVAIVEMSSNVIIAIRINVCIPMYVCVLYIQMRVLIIRMNMLLIFIFENIT